MCLHFSSIIFFLWVVYYVPLHIGMLSVDIFLHKKRKFSPRLTGKWPNSPPSAHVTINFTYSAQQQQLKRLSGAALLSSWSPLLTFPSGFYILIIFSNLNYDFSNVLDLIWGTSKNKLKKHSVSKIVLIFHCSNTLL